MHRSDNASLKPYTTMGVGGQALHLIEAYSLEDLKEAIRLSQKKGLPFFILGKGSNTLFDDRGFPGIVIVNKYQFVRWDLPCVEVSSGYSFSLLGVQTAKKGWSGLEFAAGIPATVGGAIYMNAGASQSETFGPLLNVTYLDEKGETRVFAKEELEFGYRFSSFQNMKGVIVSATFKLKEDLLSRKRQIDLLEYRIRTQPYSDPSAGCIFRNPKETSAGALIESCGLKGEKVGGAFVSTLHANFIVNKNGATTADVITLAELIEKKVFEKSGIKLEMEVRRAPYE